MKFILAVLLIVAAALLLVGYYVFRTACVRAKEMPWYDPAALRETKWAALADYIQDALNYLNANNVQDVSVTSHDGLQLHGRWLPAKDAKGTILLFHGYRSSAISDFSVIVSFYHGLGFNLLLADQRSHGKSQGKYITFGIQEHRDVLTWIEYHNTHMGTGPVFLGGMSMGAATVLMAAGEPLPENIRGVIADCGFTDPFEIISKVMRQSHVPAFPLLYVAELYSRLLGRFGLREYSTIQAMQTCRVPVLMIHGTGDDFVPCEMTKRAYDACRSEKQLILVEGAGHGTSYLTEPERCKNALKQFLGTHLAD